MSSSGSETRLAHRVLAAVGLLAVCAAAFYFVQNRFGPVGGAIAPAKLGWLAFAILFWLVLPAFIASDRRVPVAVRRVFAILFVLMALRSIVELWMLYVTLTWSPWYGIAHDVACLAALVVGAVRAGALGGFRSRFDRLLGAHLAVTATMFLPEIWFAYYMTVHFGTTGEGAVYFVPADDPRHRMVLRATAAAVAGLAVYAPVFLWRWLGGTPDGARATAQ